MDVIAERGAPTPARYGRGLEGLVAGSTAISTIDGEAGVLSVRGVAIESLAEHLSFDALAHVVVFGTIPTGDERAAWHERLNRWRTPPAAAIDALRDAAELDLFERFRQGVSAAAAERPTSDDDPVPRLLEWTSAIAGAAVRLHVGRAPVPPRDDLRYAEHVLWSMLGEVPNPAAVRAFEVSLVVQAEHGLHAAALAALVTHSGGAGLDDAVVSGIAALGGPLHGGANRPAYTTLMSFSSADEARAWATERIAERYRFPGYGHRVYKSRDPRSAVLEPYARALLAEAGDPTRWEIYEATKHTIESALGSKGIYANIDAITGLVYGPLGIPLDAFTVPFCLAIQTGWIAHCLEYGRGRVLQPESLEVGS